MPWREPTVKGTSRSTIRRIARRRYGITSEIRGTSAACSSARNCGVTKANDTPTWRRQRSATKSAKRGR